MFQVMFRFEGVALLRFPVRLGSQQDFKDDSYRGEGHWYAELDVSKLGKSWTKMSKKSM